ncbi:hypothetical protein MCHI_003676 [Candidatus Magnetoovum chiemensis]|nr:hypothetical protein MCHI_003676 [Candidatus Magnetoovum chiemensis]
MAKCIRDTLKGGKGGGSGVGGGDCLNAKRDDASLTRSDRISVYLYRGSIAATGVLLILLSFTWLLHIAKVVSVINDAYLTLLLLLFYTTAGTSVFFLHLYIGKLHRFLKKLYFVSILCLAVLFILGAGSPVKQLSVSPLYLLLLVPLSVSIGSITAKEAFCFRIYEGYMITFALPIFITAYSFGVFSQLGAALGITFISVLYVIFAIRKIALPHHLDIGDKSAYTP